ncbi:MAG: hypothetical protein GWN18_12940, partial [Thermoplasmata archaeon]|nr:hypothetical protein [Thermoplasmata archaeon]NIS12961.1 hypothetical protein [Thermoplasmata archaeon]NIS20869.1 hypothetical protein [Thermoplasmata archaeon]NIT78289.1 hypothetical protein [Thermoplasmata archaeon]NIU49925.1 hypothetical protein [Thermoplasmata archaeon]
YHIDADAEGAAAGTLYMYNYFCALNNYIGSDGQSPATFSGLTVVDQKMTW